MGFRIGMPFGFRIERLMVERLMGERSTHAHLTPAAESTPHLQRTPHWMHGNAPSALAEGANLPGEPGDYLLYT